jgi:hypothetical protein
MIVKQKCPLCRELVEVRETFAGKFALVPHFISRIISWPLDVRFVQNVVHSCQGNHHKVTVSEEEKTWIRQRRELTRLQLDPFVL